MKQKLISLVLIGLFLASAQAPLSGQAKKVAASSSQPQGDSPFAIAITKDGEYAYLSFGLSEDIFKVRLEDLAVVAVVDLSEYFPIECQHIALNGSEEKLFVYTPTWDKLIILDTQTLSVIHTIDNISINGMTLSQYGPFLITWDGGSTVRLVNTESYEITEITDNSIGFFQIQESKSDQGHWYVVNHNNPEGWIIGIYDYAEKVWNYSVSLPLQDTGHGFSALQVLPNGQKAYLAAIGGWYPDYHSYGWLYSVDLVGGEVNVVPIDGGVMCLEASPDSQRLYVGTGWPLTLTNDGRPLPNPNNLLVVDTASDSIVGPIPLGRNKYGWAYTQMNDLQIDPTNPRFLYATNADGNAFIKVDIDGSAVAGVMVTNNETFGPHFFVRRQAESFGNILIHQSAKSFELNLDNATIQGLVTFPAIRQDLYAYDIGVLNTGRLLIAQGQRFLEVDPQGMQLTATHPLPPGTPSVLQFVLSNDKTKIYTVAYSSGGIPNIFMAIDTTTFQVEKQLNLAGGSFEFRPFELPDGSKLYALGGLQNGPVVVHVIRTADYTIQNTITFDQSDRLGIAAGPFFPYAYDPVSHTLFVGATQVVLAIDTDTDVIKKVIYLGDVATAIGLEPRELTYINADGMVYNPQENYLYIAHTDHSFISIYDLENDEFLPQVIPLKGFFPDFVFANDDYSKIYTLNMRSDSVSVIDVPSKTVEKVIDLHDYLFELYLPLILRSTH